MRYFLSGLVALTFVAGCDGNPLASKPGGSDSGGSTDTPIHGVALPPGTTSPTPKVSIQRQEAQDNSATSATRGNGYAGGYTYDAANDTFTVTGLGFDGGNVYHRGTQVGALGGYAVYQADDSYSDDVTGVPIDQYSHRLLYGVSKDGRTAFAIVRTGAYVNYGFGGFIYQRKDGVTLPTSGEADYTGKYAALRDFSGVSGLEFADGTMNMSIDFDGFNGDPAVNGTVTGRHIYDINGDDITSQVIAAMNTKLKPGVPITELPTLNFNVGPGVLDKNGEMSGALNSFYVDSGGAAKAYETGNFYAVVSGAGAAQQVTGVIVVTGDETRAEGVKVRETGGFILYRP